MVRLPESPLVRRTARADESDQKRLVRFDFPGGLDAAAIAQAMREQGRRILDEAAERKQAAERDAGQAQPETPAKKVTGQAEGRLVEEPEAET